MRSRILLVVFYTFPTLPGGRCVSALKVVFLLSVDRVLVTMVLQ